MNRRTFICASTMSVVEMSGLLVAEGQGRKQKTRRATSPAPLDPYDTLINHQYANRIRLLRQEGGLNFGKDFRLSSEPTDWLLKLGRYQGNAMGNHFVLYGYWIFRPDVNKCWQAVNGKGPFRYWNEDGHAVGNPEDWELFRCQAVSKPDRTIKLYNARYGAYVGLVGDVFACDESEQHAAIFQVEFV